MNSLSNTANQNLKKIIRGSYLIGTFLVLCSGIQSNEPVKPIPTIDKEFLIVAHIIAADSTQFEDYKKQISPVIATVNDLFEPIKASFKICDFRFIPEQRYAPKSEEYHREELDAKFWVKKRINMFFSAGYVDKPEASGFATLGGISSTNGKPLVHISYEGINTGVIGHELGHYFGLPHTFAVGDELADGSNCATAGDRFCDTPADPYVDGTEAKSYLTGCSFSDRRKDTNGDYYNPLVSNIMSYYPSNCRCGGFTPQQLQRMVNTYNGTIISPNAGEYVW